MYELSRSAAAFAKILLRENEDRGADPRSQLHTRPEIDEVVCHTLEGDTLKDALNFIDNIRASKMKIEWSSINVWAVYRGFKHVMDIKVANNTWSITLLLDHAKSGLSYISDEMEGMRNLINAPINSVSNQREVHYASS